MNATAQRALVAPAPHSLAQLIDRVRDEYEEMPCLCLTLPQAQRLWGLEQSHCEAVLAALVQGRFLRATPRGYLRA
jgi:hypothetical protein